MTKQTASSYLDPLISARKRTLPSSSFAKTIRANLVFCLFVFLKRTTSSLFIHIVNSIQLAVRFHLQHRALLLGTSASSAENNHSCVG